MNSVNQFFFNIISNFNSYCIYFNNIFILKKYLKIYIYITYFYIPKKKTLFLAIYIFFSTVVKNNNKNKICYNKIKISLTLFFIYMLNYLRNYEHTSSFSGVKRGSPSTAASSHESAG